MRAESIVAVRLHVFISAMDEILQHFDVPIRDSNDDLYGIYLYGRSRPNDTWQGWLVFERRRDRVRFATPIETTQPNRQAILYWATGLTDTYLEGALTRAMRGERPSHIETPRPAPPLVGYGVDSAERRARLTHIERDILTFFDRGRNRVLTQELFDAVPHAHADVVRALKDLERQGHFVDRRTEEGNDWVVLTDEGQRL